MTKKIEFTENFIYELRKFELSDLFITLGDNISPNLCEYLRALNKCSFVDGSYHTYFGKVKDIIDEFVYYWMEMMNDIIKQADRYTNVITKIDLINLLEKTIRLQQIKQVDFGKEFLPVETELEREMYDEIEKDYKAMLENLYQLQARVEKFDIQNTIEEFLKDYLELSIKKKNGCFQLAHTRISIFLSDNVDKIRMSLEETLVRMRNNLYQLEDKRDEEITELHNQLYEKNKEHLHISRQERLSSEDDAEVSESITRLRQKIENSILSTPIIHLTNEIQYWEQRFADFNILKRVVIKVKKAQESVNELEKTYNEISCKESPGTRFLACFENIGENIKRRKEYLDEKMVETSKALFTFFGVRGITRILYEDYVGKYTVDEYGHQIYYLNFGKNHCHVTCDGSFREVQYTDKYYYDDGGRYIIDESGVKLYQVAPCTSTYELGKDNVLYKTTKDCGHSEKVNPICKMELKDPTDVEILPNLNPMDIKDTLKPEIVKYLWDSLGHVVPDALRDVGVLVPKNPIHILAHRIIAHKYTLRSTEFKKKAKEAEEYRAEIYKKRKDKAMAASKLWKSKQVKRRKPEESDNFQDWAAYNQYLSQNQFISSLDYD